MAHLESCRRQFLHEVMDTIVLSSTYESRASIFETPLRLVSKPAICSGNLMLESRDPPTDVRPSQGYGLARWNTAVAVEPENNDVQEIAAS